MGEARVVTLIYHAKSVGPVCRKLAEQADSLRLVDDHGLLSLDDTAVVRWGSTWQGKAEREINSADSVALAKDKIATRKLLADLCPQTWYELGDIYYPCIIRPKNHFGGHKFFVCNTLREAQRAIRRCRRGWYASEIVNKAREFRVFALMGYCVAVTERFPNDNGHLAWNLAQGGRMKNVRYKQWPIGAILTALQAAKLANLDWAAVDIVVDQEGKALVLELNTAPGLRSEYRIEQIAAALDWLNSSDVKERVVKEGRTETWKTLIHPSQR